MSRLVRFAVFPNISKLNLLHMVAARLLSVDLSMIPFLVGMILVMVSL